MARNTQTKQSVSAFARVIQQLLDDTGFYTRAEWSRFLGISGPALSQWVNDRTIPRADLLRMVLDLLEIRGGTKACDALNNLDAIMDTPAESISPIGSRFGQNLRAYLRARPLSEVGQSLRNLSAAQQIAALRGGGIGGTADAEPVAMRPDEPIVAILDSGRGPAWRMPRLVRATGLHGRERQVAVDEFAACNRMTLVGSPGSGKTAFLSYLTSQHPNWRQSEVIGLRSHSADAFGELLDARLLQGPLESVIIDGLDEMPMGHRERTIALIGRFSEEAACSRILVASRPLSELDQLSGFESFSIAPLSDIDLVAEVTRSSLASRSPVEVDRFLCHLTERESLRAAVRSPLFLQVAWSLFENSAVTPFEEGAIVREYTRVLFERDIIKGASRMRAPWATSHGLLALLGEVSLQLLNSDKGSFNEKVLERWISNSPWKVPVSGLLDLLLVHGLLTELDGEYSFSHRILKDYFAARFVVESTVSAVEYFKTGSKKSAYGGAIRMACSLASDSTPLLETVMSSATLHTTNFILLAQMLAQPIAARSQVIEDSCRTVVAWLDNQTHDWKIMDGQLQPGASSAKWLVCANVGRSKGSGAVAGTLRAVHQARSGPAYEHLKSHLSEARSPFLTAFSEAMDVEGRLKVNIGSEHGARGAARVAVETLQLA